MESRLDRIEDLTRDIQGVLSMDETSISNILDSSGYSLLAVPKLVKLGLRAVGATKKRTGEAIRRLMADLVERGLNDSNVGEISVEVFESIKSGKEGGDISQRIVEMTKPEELKKRAIHDGLHVKTISEKTIEKIFNAMVVLFEERLEKDNLVIADISTIAEHLWFRISSLVYQLEESGTGAAEIGRHERFT